jgi:hypothetical protein
METVEFLKNLTYAQYLETKWWQFTRQRRLEFDKYKCCKCQTSHELEAHHLTYERLGDENVKTDLITLCDRCHNDTHYFEELKKSTATEIMIKRQLPITRQDYEYVKTIVKGGLSIIKFNGEDMRLKQKATR